MAISDKIKTRLKPDNFKRFKQKRLQLSGVVSVEADNPKRQLEIRRINRQHVVKRPNKISVKPPLSLRERKVKPLRPPKPELEVQEVVVRRPLPKLESRVIPFVDKRRFVSEARRNAVERGRGHAIQQKLARIKQPESLRNNISAQIKSIEALKGIGSNRVLVMIAAGPSVLEVDLSPIVGHSLIDFMCINKPYEPVWPSRFWAFCDNTQQKRNTGYWDKFKGIIINSPNVRARRSNQIIVRSRPGQGFCKDVTKGYHIGRSSTYANLQVALYMDYERIYIFGIDMCSIKKDGGEEMLHHYGQNNDVSPENRKSRFPQEAKHYLWAGQNMVEEDRKKIFFCSSYNPWPFLKYFNHLDHLKAVEHALGYVSKI
jgi:hypothetical protein